MSACISTIDEYSTAQRATSEVWNQSVDGLKQRGFAAPCATNDKDEFTLIKLEIDITQDRLGVIGVGNRDVFKPDHAATSISADTARGGAMKTLGNGGAMKAGVSAIASPRTASIGRAGHVGGSDGVVICKGTSQVAIRNVPAAKTPDRAISHSGNHQGSGR
jgi:hypothetical protein